MTYLISITDAIEEISKGVWNEQELIDRIKALPSAEPHNKDAISREGLLKSWEELSPRGRLEFDQVIMTIPALPSADAEWILCSERLPKEEKKTYWVCTDTEYQCECRWTNNRFGLGEGEWGWSIFDTPQYSKPIAWQPLPAPYKGGGTE